MYLLYGSKGRKARQRLAEAQALEILWSDFVDTLYTRRPLSANRWTQVPNWSESVPSPRKTGPIPVRARYRTTAADVNRELRLFATGAF